MFFVARAPGATDRAGANEPSAANDGHRRAEDGSGKAGAPGPIDPIEQSCQHLAAKHRLSQRQTEVLVLLAHGYDVRAIAKKLFVSENTVRTHAKKIYAALDVHSKQEIIELTNEMRSG